MIITMYFIFLYLITIAPILLLKFNSNSTLIITYSLYHLQKTCYNPYKRYYYNLIYITEISMENINKRYSNFELLRIIGMLMIIADHFSVHGDFTFSTNTITINRLFMQLLAIGGNLGTNLFVLISGYFMVTNKNIKINKLLKLFCQIFFYSTSIYTIGCFTGLINFEIRGLIKCLFPITFNQWWFASTYFVLYLISPYLNMTLNNLEKKQYIKMLLLLTFCWSIVPTITNRPYQSNELLWFIYLYSIAAFFRLHGDAFKINSKTSIIIGLTILLLTFTSAFFFDILGIKWNIFAKQATYFYKRQKLPILLTSLFLFLGFEKLQIKCNSIINKIALTTFGIYLIHDNNIIRSFLWKELFKNAEYSNSIYLIPYSIFVILIVFTVCSIIEFFRISVIEKTYMKIIYKIQNHVSKLVLKLSK